MAKSWLDRITKAKNADKVIEKMTIRLEELAHDLEKLRAVQAEVKDIEAAMEYNANEVYADDSEVSYVMGRFEVTFTARRLVRKIKDMPALMQRLGKKVFLQHATFPLKDLDSLIPKIEQKNYVSSKRNGPRACRIKINE